MRSLQEIEQLLNELDHCIADDLEDQDLDFKQWNTRSMSDSVNQVVKMAICMANGGGGTVVFGVADQVFGRTTALLGVPPVVDVHRLKKTVYDNTDPKITPVFEELRIPEGTGRLLVMQVYPGIPPYTDTAGRGTVRISKDCQPLTGSLRRKISVETGESDYTAETVDGTADILLSPSSLEQLRDIASLEKAPADLLQLQDMDLLAALDLLHQGKLTRAALLLAGTEQAIRKHVPGYVWTFLRMESDTQYSNRDDRCLALPKSIIRLEEHIAPYNPIATVEHGLFHFEYRTYPAIALREALLNAFCHADYRSGSPIIVKLFNAKLEIGNPGGFIAGITPRNILHHEPAPRNPLLVDALVRLRLVNRSNLGIARMFEAFLIEGKQPPMIEEIGESVKVTMRDSSLSPGFRAFIAGYSQKGKLFSIDELLIFHHLLTHPEITTRNTATLCQRREREALDILAGMNMDGFLERGGTGRATYWTLPPKVFQAITGAGYPEQSRRIDWEAAKTRVLSVLMERARRGEAGLTNREIRQITHFDRNQVYRLMKQLRRENNAILPPGRGKYACYRFRLK